MNDERAIQNRCQKRCTHDELAEITGCVRYGWSIDWLKNGLKHTTEQIRSARLAAGTPAEARRDNATADNAEAWAPNFATIK